MTKNIKFAVGGLAVFSLVMLVIVFLMMDWSGNSYNIGRNESDNPAARIGNLDSGELSSSEVNSMVTEMMMQSDDDIRLFQKEGNDVAAVSVDGEEVVNFSDLL